MRTLAGHFPKEYEFTIYKRLASVSLKVISNNRGNDIEETDLLQGSLSRVNAANS